MKVENTKRRRFSIMWFPILKLPRVSQNSNTITQRTTKYFCTVAQFSQIGGNSNPLRYTKVSAFFKILRYFKARLR